MEGEEDIHHDPFEDYYFRSLRPDEAIEKLEAKDSKPENLRDQDARTTSIMEHIRYGSRPEYKSPWLSLTADLDVALAFAGTVQTSSKRISTSKCDICNYSFWNFLECLWICF